MLRKMLRELNNDKLKQASFEQLLIDVAVKKGDSGERTRDRDGESKERPLDLWNE